jgi:adenylate cyclase
MTVANVLRAQMRLAPYIRIGIHSGSVTAGVAGKSKFTYDIWGDAVNVAARMAGAGERAKWMFPRAHTITVKSFFEATALAGPFQ